MKKSSVIGTDELLRKFKALGETVQGENLALATDAGGMVILNAARENIKSQGLIRTRTLSRSLSQEHEDVTPTQVTNVIGTNVEYGPIHEYGGVIRARSGKYLAIPVGGSSYKDSPRNHPRLRAQKTSNGRLVLISPNGEVRYVLVQSVTIPARPYLRPAHDDNQGKAQETIGQVLRRLVMEAAGV